MCLTSVIPRTGQCPLYFPSHQGAVRALVLPRTEQLGSMFFQVGEDVGEVGDHLAEGKLGQLHHQLRLGEQPTEEAEETEQMDRAVVGGVVDVVRLRIGPLQALIGAGAHEQAEDQPHIELLRQPLVGHPLGAAEEEAILGDGVHRVLHVEASNQQHIKVGSQETFPHSPAPASAAQLLNSVLLQLC